MVPCIVLEKLFEIRNLHRTCYLIRKGVSCEVLPFFWQCTVQDQPVGCFGSRQQVFTILLACQTSLSWTDGEILADISRVFTVLGLNPGQLALQLWMSNVAMFYHTAPPPELASCTFREREGQRKVASREETVSGLLPRAHLPSQWFQSGLLQITICPT